jgi:hypothetical protein
LFVTFLRSKLVNGFIRSVYGEKAMELPERTNAEAELYAKQCIALAKEMGLCSIDLWSKMQETEGWQKKFLRFVITDAFRSSLFVLQKKIHLTFSF